jgi:hypothetical protein
LTEAQKLSPGINAFSLQKLPSLFGSLSPPPLPTLRAYAHTGVELGPLGVRYVFKITYAAVEIEIHDSNLSAAFCSLLQLQPCVLSPPLITGA